MYLYFPDLILISIRLIFDEHKNISFLRSFNFILIKILDNYVLRMKGIFDISQKLMVDNILAKDPIRNFHYTGEETDQRNKHCHSYAIDIMRCKFHKFCLPTTHATLQFRFLARP